MKGLLNPTTEDLIDAALDITGPRIGVSVDWSTDGKVLWINVDGVCVLRICRIPQCDFKPIFPNSEKSGRILFDKPPTVDDTVPTATD